MPSGRPNHMYFTPNLWNAEDQLCPASADDLQDCFDECIFRSTLSCNVESYELCIDIMDRGGLDFPSTFSDAENLYMSLREQIRH